MEQFRINLARSTAGAYEMEKIAVGIGREKDDLDSVMNNLRRMNSFDGVRSKLRTLSREMEEEERRVRTMGQKMNQIVRLYRNAENKNVGRGNTTAAEAKVIAAAIIETFRKIVKDVIDWLGDLFGWNHSSGGNYEVDSIVFDDDGSYGGDQGSPRKQQGERKQELYDTIRKYYPNMSDKEAADYLKKLNSEGCGYTAVINTIFAAYEGREKEFEKNFGFPMYHNGDLNYDRLLVDYYAATDNHKKAWWGGDVIKSSEDESAVKGNGTNADSRKYRTELYLSDKNVDVSITNNKKVTPDNFEKLSEDGYVIVSFHDGNLENEDGSTAQYIHGHAMTITGVTEDGRYIVSSWGETYYIDPNKNTGQDGAKTSLSYAYYQYE